MLNQNQSETKATHTAPTQIFTTNADKFDPIFTHSVCFRPYYADITGSVASGIFLSQMEYWTENVELNQPERNGWFYKSAKEWTQETRLTRKQQETARKKLKSLGILEEQHTSKLAKAGVYLSIWYRLNKKNLQTALEKLKLEYIKEKQVVSFSNDEICLMPAHNAKTETKKPQNTRAHNGHYPCAKGTTTKITTKTTKASKQYKEMKTAEKFNFENTELLLINYFIDDNLIQNKQDLCFIKTCYADWFRTVHIPSATKAFSWVIRGFKKYQEQQKIAVQEEKEHESKTEQIESRMQIQNAKTAKNNQIADTIKQEHSQLTRTTQSTYDKLNDTSWSDEPCPIDAIINPISSENSQYQYAASETNKTQDTAQGAQHTNFKATTSHQLTERRKKLNISELSETTAKTEILENTVLKTTKKIKSREKIEKPIFNFAVNLDKVINHLSEQGLLTNEAELTYCKKNYARWSKSIQKPTFQTALTWVKIGLKKYQQSAVIKLKYHQAQQFQQQVNISKNRMLQEKATKTKKMYLVTEKQQTQYQQNQKNRRPKSVNELDERITDTSWANSSWLDDLNSYCDHDDPFHSYDIEGSTIQESEIKKEYFSASKINKNPSQYTEKTKDMTRAHNGHYPCAKRTSTKITTKTTKASKQYKKWETPEKITLIPYFKTENTKDIEENLDQYFEEYFEEIEDNEKI